MSATTPTAEGLHPMTAEERAFIAQRIHATRRRVRLIYLANALWIALLCVAVYGLLVMVRGEGASVASQVAVGVGGLVFVGISIFSVRQRVTHTPEERLEDLLLDHEEGKKEVVWGSVHKKAIMAHAYVIHVGATSVDVPRADYDALSEGSQVELHLSQHCRAVLRVVRRDEF